MRQDAAALFAEMALGLHGEQSTERTMQKVTEFARDALMCDDAGIMMGRGPDGIETKSWTAERVKISDAVQQEEREGPCFAALLTMDLFSVTDTLSEVRWPSWAKVVSNLGIRSALGVPLHARDRMIGALNLYSNEPNFFGEEEIAVAHIFGRHASVALSAATEQEGLTTAVDARNVIGQAQGILMERFNVDSDAAFDALRRYSQHKNIKLRVVAQTVIDDRSFLTEPQ